MTFEDHFSRQADRYTRFRPRYPRSLFEFLATLPAQTGRVWDCGTGNGQAAVMLGKDFAEVVATDPSERQIAHAREHPRVRYLVATAEQSPLADDSVDLVTVAQALHWFDVERFYAEVRRVVRGGGVLAAWGYEMVRVTPEIDRVVSHAYSDLLGAYWPPQRRAVETRYTTIRFPFQVIPTPTLETTDRWNLDELMGYLGTWSSVQQYIARRGNDPLVEVREALAAAWGAPEAKRRVTWPLFARVGLVR